MSHERKAEVMRVKDVPGGVSGRNRRTCQKDSIGCAHRGLGSGPPELNTRSGAGWGELQRGCGRACEAGGI